MFPVLCLCKCQCLLQVSCARISIISPLYAGYSGIYLVFSAHSSLAQEVPQSHLSPIQITGLCFDVTMGWKFWIPWKEGEYIFYIRRAWSAVVRRQRLWWTGWKEASKNSSHPVCTCCTCHHEVESISLFLESGLAWKFLWPTEWGRGNAVSCRDGVFWGLTAFALLEASYHKKSSG